MGKKYVGNERLLTATEFIIAVFVCCCRIKLSLITDGTNLHHEDWCGMFLSNIDTHLSEYTVSRPKIPQYGKCKFFSVKAGSIHRSCFCMYLISALHFSFCNWPWGCWVTSVQTRLLLLLLVVVVVVGSSSSPSFKEYLQLCTCNKACLWGIYNITAIICLQCMLRVMVFPVLLLLFL